jgi:choline dehydrogenase-like flavoprotein
VGAGAAGISLALQYIGTGISVVLLESGGLEADAATQSLYAGTVADERLHSPPDRYRQRRFGGTTTIWGGRCMPFDEIDFEARDWLPHSGWPFQIAELLPYYAAANRLCEAGEFAYAAAAALPAGSQPIIADFHSEHFSDDTLERFSCPTDFGARYLHRLQAATNIRLILHANVTNIRLLPAGDGVASLDVRTLAGARTSVTARHFVLATGGIETPRLLLASRDQLGSGIGNRHDQVGRYYMCHLAGTIGAIRIRRPLAAVHHGYDLSSEGIYCRRRFALRAGVQRERSLGNFVARLHHPRITDPAHRNAVLSLLYMAKPFIPYEYAKRLHGDEQSGTGAWLRHALNVATGPAEAAGFAWHMLRDRKLAERKFPSIILKSRANLYSIDFHAEQQPNAGSRITLGSEPDALGMPRVHVDWQYTANDVATVKGALALLAQDFAGAGVGELEYQPESVEYEMTRYGAYGGHHIGTARMGSDAATSVVNADCRVHGIDNLYIAGAATFPTSSQANPTLTIVALALRLAQHLKERLRAEGPST